MSRIIEHLFVIKCSKCSRFFGKLLSHA